MFPIPHPKLPTRIEQAYWVRSPYNDASHRIIKLHTAANQYFLKWPQKHWRQLPFWQMSQAWFDLAIDTNYKTGSVLAELVQHSPLSLVTILEANHQVLSVALVNDGVPSHLSSQAQAKLLAHYQAMQRLEGQGFGRLAEPRFDLALWSERLENSLMQLDLPSQWVQAAITKSKTSPERKTCPLMLDWRWDQLSWQGGVPMGIIDLDAWVWAPDTLNWVMLEYLLVNLTAEEVAQWQRVLNIDPKHLAAWRDVYRIALFAMNWQGATDLQAWLAAPALFD